MTTELSDTGFLLQNLMDNLTDNIYFKDTDSRFIMVNTAFCEWTGLSAEQMIGSSDFDLFAESHAKQAYEDEQRIMKAAEPLVGVEEKETWPDGRVTWVSTTKMPLKSESGKIIGTFGVSRDITAHKEAELKANFFADQIRRIKEEMEEDVRMAAELQKTFFPTNYPCFPRNVSEDHSCVEFGHHYHASGMVSGDFCTIRRVSENEVCVFVCDVIGHGVRAALGTALICAMVEELSTVENDPGVFLDRMNELLLPIMRQEDMFLYATACYMVFNVSTGVLRVANAGHPQPFHFDAKANEADWLITDNSLRGPALAVEKSVTYQTFKTILKPGDSVVLYTDGLYEVETPAGEEFGEQRLLNAAQKLIEEPLEDVFLKLVKEAHKHAGADELDDDVCLVGLRFKRPMI